MALVSLGIIGKENEPLYMKEFTADANTSFHVDGGLDFDEDIFDVPSPDKSNNADSSAPKAHSCSLRQQFILHAALDRFEELGGAHAGSRWRTPGSAGSDAMWVGLLCPIEELRVYGYLSTTKIKFIAVIEDTFLPDQTQQQQARESELKSLLAKVHSLYVEHTLNPFNKLNSAIVSRRFEEGVARSVNAFNHARTAAV